jgi:hypothetical protein
MMLLGIAILGTGGWWAHGQISVVETRKTLLAGIEKLGGGYVICYGTAPFAPPEATTVYDRPITEVGQIPNSKWPALLGEGRSNEPTRVRQWFGDQIIEMIWLPPTIAGTNVFEIKGAFPEAIVLQATDAG